MHSTKLAVTLCATVLCGGCARRNPAFSDAEVMEGSGGVTSSSGRAPAETTTGSHDSQSTGGKTTGDSSGKLTADSSSGAMESSGSNSTGTAPACPQSPADPARFQVLVDSSVQPPAANCTEVIVRSLGSITVNNGDIFQQECETCGCDAAGGLQVDFTDDVDLPELPGCGTLVLWPGYDADGECRWDGAAVFSSANDTIPEFFALNSRSFPSSYFGNVLVEFDGSSDCLNPGQCAEPPGPYDLTFFDGDAVTPGSVGNVDIGFFASAPFNVHNRMSFVDAACGEHVAWTGSQL